MELDPLTKWLLRIASSFIILTGLVLVIAIPTIAIKLNSTVSSTQEALAKTLELLLHQSLTSLS